MKRIIYLIALLTIGKVSAQKKEYVSPLNGINKIIVKTNSSIKLIGTDTKQLTLKDLNFQADTSKNNCGCSDSEEDSEKTKGLKIVYPGGQDDTNGYGYAVDKEDRTLILTDLKSGYQNNNIKVEIPKNIEISIRAKKDGNIYIEKFISEVEADSELGDIKMTNVTGPITAHSNIGKISIEFDKVSQSTPITISTSISEIDVSMPGNTSADLNIKTNGKVYTNFDFKRPEKRELPQVSKTRQIAQSINNGGVKIKLKSSLGNIYLRKK